MTSKTLSLALTFAVLSALYFLSQFYRVSNAVIAPNLVRDLGLTPETLGLLGGAFFFSFALLQIPMGPLLDRIGPRLVISSFVLLSAAGSFLFALGGSFEIVLLGRVLIGIGMAAVLMGALKVFVLRFPPEKFATLAGTIVSMGMIGNVLASSPLAYLASTIGWRPTFMAAGGAAALLACLSFWILEKDLKGEGGTAPSRSTGGSIGILSSMGMILKTLSFWQIALLGLFRYGTFVGLQGLWLGPYLMQIEGYSPVQAGNMLILMAGGSILGGPIAGRLSDQVFRSRKGVAFWGLVLYALSIFPLIWIPRNQNPWVYMTVFFFMGFFANFGLLIFSHAKELFPPAMSGTVMTFVNFFTMAGGALFMPVIGTVIGMFPPSAGFHPVTAYRVSFGVCFLGMASSLIFYAFSDEKKRVEEKDIEKNGAFKQANKDVELPCRRE